MVGARNAGLRIPKCRSKVRGSLYLRDKIKFLPPIVMEGGPSSTALKKLTCEYRPNTLVSGEYIAAVGAGVEACQVSGDTLVCGGGAVVFERDLYSERVEGGAGLAVRHSGTGN